MYVKLKNYVKFKDADLYFYQTAPIVLGKRSYYRQVYDTKRWLEHELSPFLSLNFIGVCYVTTRTNCSGSETNG